MRGGNFTVVVKGFRLKYSFPFRLRLADGTCIFMLWHNYCGPQFFKDKECNRILDDWWENDLINTALDWFINRGNRA